MKTLHEGDAYVIAELLQMYPGAQSIKYVFTMFPCMVIFSQIINLSVVMFFKKIKVRSFIH